MSPESLGVFLAGERVGTLAREGDWQLSFRYCPQWLVSPGRRAISLSLPLTDQPFQDEAARSFFRGLLPRGHLRSVICQRRGLSEDDLLAQLKALAGDCPGAVSLATGDAPDRQRGYLEISRTQLQDLAAAPPVLPQLSGAGGIRLTLAGSRDKLPVYLEGNHIYLPVGGSPSSHILKFGSRETVANELLTNLMAQGLGLTVPEMVMVSTGSSWMVVIKRFDRALGDSGKLQRLHSEDLCQALGDDQRLQDEGPSLARCFEVLARHSVEPALDLEALLRWQAFNLLVNNPNGKAENLSLILWERGVRLAPFCGLRTGPDHGDTRLALGQQDAAGRVHIGDWRTLARQVGVKEKYLLSLVAEMARRMEQIAQDTAEVFQKRNGDSPVIQLIQPVIRQQARRTLELLTR